jgi:hypothetical protein
MNMSIDELETIASRLRTLVRDAVEFGQNRNMVLDLVEELANDIQDQADELVSKLEEEFRNDRLFVSSL